MVMTRGGRGLLCATRTTVSQHPRRKTAPLTMATILACTLLDCMKIKMSRQVLKKIIAPLFGEHLTKECEGRDKMFKVVVEYTNNTEVTVAEKIYALSEAIRIQDDLLERVGDGELPNVELVSIKRVPDWQYEGMFSNE